MKLSTTGLTICIALVLVACSTPPRKVETQPPVAVVESQSIAPARGGGGYLEGDGPGANAPADINGIPDAVPRSEPLHSFANRQYVALGETYTPLFVVGSYKQRGIASWYGKKFHGQRTSSGETYDMYAMTAAHPTLPIPSYARVTNTANQKSVVVRINDRGPFLHDRIIDLSYTAAYKLGLIGSGSGEVEVESLPADTATIPPVATTQTVTVASLPPTLRTASLAVEAAASAGSTSANAVPAGQKFADVLPEDGRIYLQLGAFKSRQGAESFLDKMRAALGDLGKQVGLFEKDGMVRVHVGPYASKNEAHAVAEQLRERLGFKPFVSEH